MAKPKYTIVPMEDYALNHAYSEGYEFVAVWTETFSASNYSNSQYHTTTTGININIPSQDAHSTAKALMQLTKTAEVLYGQKPTE